MNYHVLAFTKAEMDTLGSVLELFGNIVHIMLLTQALLNVYFKLWPTRVLARISKMPV